MDSFAAKFDEVIGDFWEPHPKPTDSSLAEIGSRLRLSIPKEFSDFAKASSRFSNVFLSLGDNYESHNHIIPYNLYWKSRRRTRRLPSDLVIITDGFMDEDFWCLVRPPIASSAGNVAVEYWSPAPIGYPKGSHRGPRYESFTAFLEMLISDHSQRVKPG
jgi:hypothetical protein